MLAIRMQRTGRKGHAMFRVVVQDSRRTPTSGKVVASLGSYDPHAKSTTLDKEKASFYLTHGAQPSERAARLLKSEGIALPDWVSISEAKTGKVRNADKRRSTRPAEEVVPEEVAVVAEAPVEAAAAPAEPEAPTEEAAATVTPDEPEDSAADPSTEEESKEA